MVVGGGAVRRVAVERRGLRRWRLLRVSAGCSKEEDGRRCEEMQAAKVRSARREEVMKCGFLGRDSRSLAKHDDAETLEFRRMCETIGCSARRDRLMQPIPDTSIE